MTAPQSNDPKTVAADIAREYREDAARWTRGWYARNALGKQCGVDDPLAVCWCLRGAIEKRVGDGDESLIVMRAFDEALGFQWHDGNNEVQFVNWNDHPTRTVGEVIALCDAVTNGTALKDVQP